MEFITQLDTGVQIAIVSGLTAIIVALFTWLGTKAKYSTEISELKSENKILKELTPENLIKQYDAVVQFNNDLYNNYDELGDLYDKAVTKIDDLKYEDRNKVFKLLNKVLTEAQQEILEKGKSVRNIPTTKLVKLKTEHGTFLADPNELDSDPKGSLSP